LYAKEVMFSDFDECGIITFQLVQAHKMLLDVLANADVMCTNLDLAVVDYP